MMRTDDATAADCQAQSARVGRVEYGPRTLHSRNVCWVGNIAFDSNFNVFENRKLHRRKDVVCCPSLKQDCGVGRDIVRRQRFSQ